MISSETEINIFDSPNWCKTQIFNKNSNHQSEKCVATRKYASDNFLKKIFVSHTQSVHGLIYNIIKKQKKDKYQ